MEMGVLVLQIDFFPIYAFWSPPLLLALHPLSSSTSVVGLCHVAPETYAHHHLSQTYCLYIVDRKVLGAALLPFSSEQRLWVTFKYDTIAEESLRGSVLIATESCVLYTEQERPEQYLHQVLLACRYCSWGSLTILHHQRSLAVRPAIKSRKAMSGKQRDNSLCILQEGSPPFSHF